MLERITTWLFSRIRYLMFHVEKYTGCFVNGDFTLTTTIKIARKQIFF